MNQRKDDGMKYFRIGGETYVAGPSDLLGKGTYGIVYRVHNERDASIKKAIKTFSPDSMDENDGIPSTTLREINAMMTLDHPNVMKAQDVVFPKDGSMVDMFVVMELCKGTLKDKLAGLIQEHLGNDFRWTRPTSDMKLPPAYVRQAKIISFQLLNALAVLHSRGIMHRDLKPVNIMWGFDDLLKLGDFGLARFVRGNQNSSDSVMPQTGEVQTMWYRAPEVLLGDERYGLKVDDWSIGCIIAEMFRFYRSSSGRIMASPLFAGKSDVETLLMIFDALGTPDPNTSASVKYLESLPNWSKEYPKWTPTLRQRVQLIDETGFDLLSQLLCTSPFDRQAAKFLLQHSWFDAVREDCKRFVPWYRGFEEGYKRMVAVNRLPKAQPLTARPEQQQPPAAAAAATGPSRSVSGPHVRSKVGIARPENEHVASSSDTRPPDTRPSDSRPPEEARQRSTRLVRTFVPAANAVSKNTRKAGGAGGAAGGPAGGAAAVGPGPVGLRNYSYNSKLAGRKREDEGGVSSQGKPAAKPLAQRQKRTAVETEGTHHHNNNNNNNNNRGGTGGACGSSGVPVRGAAGAALAPDDLPVGKRLRHAAASESQRLLDSYVTRVEKHYCSSSKLETRSDAAMSDISATTAETSTTTQVAVGGRRQPLPRTRSRVVQ